LLEQVLLDLIKSNTDEISLLQTLQEEHAERNSSVRPLSPASPFRGFTRLDASA
jgi:hypothetical protein